MAVERATVANGCLEFATGRHREGLIGLTEDGILAQVAEASLDFTPCEMEPGDVAVFSSYIPHRSRPNHSGERRALLYLTYNAQREGYLRDEYYRHKRAALKSGQLSLIKHFQGVALSSPEVPDQQPITARAEVTVAGEASLVNGHPLAAPTAAPTAGSPSAAQHGATGTPGAAPSTSPPSPPSPVHTEKSTESKRGPTMELWLLDRGIRWAPGSKAKRSKLLAGPQAGLFQDARKTVVEQLRDALVANSMRVIDLFREWDDDGNGEITKEEFRKAIPRLGLVGHSDSIDTLFDEFDLDHGGTITFRELNKQLRRDVKTEKVVRDGVKVEKGVEIADVAKLRRSIKYGLLNIVNTECFSIDLFTGERKYSGL